MFRVRQRILQRFPWVKPLAKRFLRRGGYVPYQPSLPSALPPLTFAQRFMALVSNPYKDYLRVDNVLRERNRDFYLANLHAFQYAPKFSIVVPLYNTPADIFQKMLDSVEKQLYENWELLLVDDCSPLSHVRPLIHAAAARNPQIKVRLRPRNGGISDATNDGINAATGDFVAFLDHDDELSDDALYFLAERLNHQPDADVLYTDQDKISEDQIRYDPLFKPDWSLDYFRGAMFLGHLVAVRRSLLLAVGGCNRTFNGVQDFDLELRLAEKTTRFEHIPRICYHWRAVPGSLASNVHGKDTHGLDPLGKLQQIAVQQHLDRLGIPAIATPANDRHRLHILPKPLPAEPRISILICSKDAPEEISRCLDTLFGKTTYKNFEVLVGDNGTTHHDALAALRRHPIRRIPMPAKFHFAAFNNALAREASGEYLVFLNNDTEILDADWLGKMLLYARQTDVGAVGPLLLFPNGAVQHAGIILGPRGSADHVMRNFPADCDGYAGSLCCSREVTAVTAACLMMSKARFFLVGGFNELFRNHYEDVDLNMKLRTKGLRNIYAASTRLIHHESKTRGQNYDFNDRILLLDLWESEIDQGDPYYNRNFNRENVDYSTCMSVLES